MSFFHFVNCVVLAYAPYFISYRYSNLSDYTSVWKCIQAGIIYFVTQFFKMMAVATFFPTFTNESNVDTFNLTLEMLKNSVDLVDVIGLHLAISYFISGKGAIRFFTAGFGWSAAHSIANYFIGFFFCARSAGFEWTFVQNALNSNFDLIFYISMSTLIWLFNRLDFQQSMRNFVGLLIILCVFYNVIYQIFFHVFLLRSWALLGAKAIFIGFIFLLTLLFYSILNGSVNAIGNSFTLNHQKTN